LREEEDAGTGWRGKRKMKACAGKGVRLEEENQKRGGRLGVKEIGLGFFLFFLFVKIAPSFA